MRRRSRQPLGQHFLHDRNTLERIAASLGFAPGAAVVEIGPGEGALSAFLFEQGAKLTAIEVDSRLAGDLAERFPGIRVLAQDVLTADLAALVSPGGFLTGNLPYYITSPIIRRALDLGARITRAVFLVQKEVALRIVAEKGSRDYGYLSALCQLRTRPELLFTVRPGAFRPPPRVDSAVVRLTPFDAPAPPAGLIRFLEAAFRQPRKTLRNNLVGLYPRETVANHPAAGLRAQQLDAEELRDLWAELEERAEATAASPGRSFRAP